MADGLTACRAVLCPIATEVILVTPINNDVSFIYNVWGLGLVLV